MSVGSVKRTCLLAFVVQLIQGQDIQSTCPANGFMAGELSYVNCIVNRTYFDTCFPGANDVKFFFRSSDGQLNDWCFTSYQTCENTGTSFPACNGCSCKCVSQNATSGYSTYSLEYNASMEHDKGSFSCEISCFPASQTEDQTRCQNVRVESATTVPPTSSTEFTTPSTAANSTAPPPQNSSTTDDDVWKIITGGTAGGGGFVAACGVVAYVFWKRKLSLHVCFSREQIRRVSLCTENLRINLHKLTNNKLMKRFSAKVKRPDGESAKYPGYKILVERRRKTGLLVWMDIMHEVKDFLEKHVRAPFVRTIVVLEHITIPDEKSINKKSTKGHEDIRIFPADKNKDGKYVIQIEGWDQKEVGAVEEQIKDQLNKRFERDVPLQKDATLDDEAREYIEEMTGTTIVIEGVTGRENGTADTGAQGRVMIKGSSDFYVEEAKKQVEDFLKRNVRMVLVPDGVYPKYLGDLIKLSSPRCLCCFCVWVKCRFKQIRLSCPCCLCCWVKCRSKQIRTHVTVSKPIENGKDQYVVKVEGSDKKSVNEAVEKVEKVLNEVEKVFNEVEKVLNENRVAA